MKVRELKIDMGVFEEAGRLLWQTWITASETSWRCREVKNAALHVSCGRKKTLNKMT